MSPSLCALQGPVLYGQSHQGSITELPIPVTPPLPKIPQIPSRPVSISSPCPWDVAGAGQGCRMGVCAWILLFWGGWGQNPVLQPKHFPRCLLHAEFYHSHHSPMDLQACSGIPSRSSFIDRKGSFLIMKTSCRKVLPSIKPRSGGRREGKILSRSFFFFLAAVKTSLFPHIWKGKLQFRASERFPR